MKKGQVIKSKRADAQDEMALVNRYARREMTQDEVYLFSVALCDNEIDRDHERFTVESLFALEKLFVGKTGIIDHDPRMRNMKARIISCAVEAVEGKKTLSGDDYFRLTARAYIPKNEENAALIDAIDAGIVREVSVGCAVEKTVCSICKNDIRSCGHVKGKTYQNEICCGELTNPTDAYEFSFVAIPAQKEAGVLTKGLGKEKDMKDILKTLFDGGAEKVMLEKSEIQSLKDYIGQLEESRNDAEEFKRELKRDVSALMKKIGVQLRAETENSILEKCSAADLKALKCAFERSTAKEEKPVTQLFSQRESGHSGKNHEFTI